MMMEDDARIDQILAQIGETGFCIVPDLIPPEECDRIRARCIELLCEEAADTLHDTGHQRIMHLLMKDRMFEPILRHPFILAVWRRYLGPDMICSTFSANALWPGSTEQYWHVDHPFWTMAEPYPLFPLAGQCIWMIDDFTIDNGATASIAGSHRRPHLPRLGHDWAPEATILTGRKGSVILADGAWWHTSRPNRTEDLRIALLNTFIRNFCVTQEDMRMQLAALPDADAETQHLLGGTQYQPRTQLPY